MKLHRAYDRKCIFIITFKNSLIIHEENIKENHISKHVASLHKLALTLILHVDLHNVFLENYFANELTIDCSFLKQSIKHSPCMFYQTDKSI